MLSGPRRGATLLELLVALLVAAVVAAAIARSRHATRAGQARTMAHAAIRQQLRAAAAAIPASMRAVAPAMGDLRVVDDSVIDVRATLGGAILCMVDSAAAVAVLATDLPGGGWAAPAHAGDSLLVLVASADTMMDAPPDARAWRWIAFEVTGDATAGQAPCLGSEQRAIVRVPIGAAVVPSEAAPPGSAVRLVRRARWSVYRAADGRWYLGYREAAAGRLSGVQPVSGPHEVRIAGARRPGVHFEARDAGGAPTADLARVARIDLVLHGTPAASTRSRPPDGPLAAESATIAIAVRHAPLP